MEYLDIYDSQGNSLGITKSREEAHSKGLWHRAAHVWIINSKKELLIQKRSHQMDDHPDKWDISAAGHVCAGEDDVTAALRETKEEIGLNLDKSDLLQIGEVKYMSLREGYINNEINTIYIVKRELDPTKIVKQKEEVSEVKLIPNKELQKIIESEDSSFVSHPKEYKLLFDYINNNL